MINKSFALVRTNPALTGNVKLVITSDNRIYLESFGVNTTLSKERYKHFEIKLEEYYKEVIPYFFADTEMGTVFAVKKEDDSAIMYDDYQFQFDSTYFSGAQFCEDTWYQEEYEYMAPLHLTKQHMPKHFLLLRVDGSGLSPTASSSANFRAEIVDKWKFVKLFDLTPKSELGTWLHKNFIEDDAIIDYPMIINHEELQLSELSGIDVDKGGWTTKYMDLTEFISKDTPIFRTEESLTELWREKGLLYPQLLNLKFLFDDTPATPETLLKYGLNRYLGFYLDDMSVVKTISPYTGFELKKASLTELRNLSAVEVATIPYVRDNMFVREVGGRTYHFDPIMNGWNDKKQYWVEFNGAFYKLQRVANTVADVLGDWMYKIIADIAIEHAVQEPDAAKAKLLKRVLINELSTHNDKMTIKHRIAYNDVVANNIIENDQSVVTKLVRVFQTVDVDGVPTLLYRLDTEVETSGNAFDIPNFNEADLFLLRIREDYYVIKRHDTTIPVIGGKYYLQTDWAVDVNGNTVECWINNGKQTKDPLYYRNYNIQNLSDNEAPTTIEVLRVQFTDIKDFDFDRVESNYANYEYEKETELSNSLEHKLYAKDYRATTLDIDTSEGVQVRRTPITDLNGRPYNVRALSGELNPQTNLPYTADELYQKNFDGTWKLFTGTYAGQDYTHVTTNKINIPTRFYREGSYILKFDGSSAEVDFRPGAFPTKIGESFTFGEDGLAEVSDSKTEIGAVPFHADPNSAVDKNYVPVSSEYVQSDELWEVRNNDLTAIWNKNQTVCKWGAMNSLASHDVPYRLNYSLDFGGLFNMEPNVFSGVGYPRRANKDLDYFYRFGLTNASDYGYYSLHLKDSYFDADKYLSTELDYFTCLFQADAVTSKGLRLSDKYSCLLSKNMYDEASTIFKGVRYSVVDVAEVVINEEEYKTAGRVVIDDIVTMPNQNYDNYKFSIIFGRKVSRSQKNPGAGSRNMGIDVYLNDYWKNIVVHLYINTDEIIEVYDYVKQQLVNIETCEVDVLYQDNAESEVLDAEKWANAEFTINDLGINLRARDLTLANFLRILGNYNYQPESDNRDAVSFIHMYADGTVSKIMDYKSTDFLLKTKLPTPFLVNENAYQTQALDPTVDFAVNNSIKNRIILGTGEFTSNGYKVDSLMDLNAYNDYPLARQITPQSTADSWGLDAETSPTMYRFSFYYAPVFKRIPLFRPLNYQQGVSLLPPGNWKFYDQNSDSTAPKLVGFGQIDELVFSKVNPDANVLKIQDETNKNKSIYPMVDEYGYDYNARYLFASNWEADFYSQSRRINIPPNEYPSSAGYTLQFNGKNSFLRIADADKFNLERYLVDEVNYESFIGSVPWEETPYTVTNPTLFISLGETEDGLSKLSPATKALWGGYLKRETQPGNLMDYPFKSKDWTRTGGLLSDLGSLFPGNVSTRDGVIQITNSVNFAFEPERWTYVKDGAGIVYIGTKTDVGGASVVCQLDLHLYLNNTPATLAFNVRTNSGSDIMVTLTTVVEGLKKPLVDLLADINTQLAAHIDVTADTSNPDYVVLSFRAKQPGYYYNFDINTFEEESLFAVKRTFAPLERTYREAFNKTSLKEGLKRVTGYIPDVTVEFWVKPTATGKRYETFLYKGEDTSADVWLDKSFTDFTWMVGKYDKYDKVCFKTAHKRVDGVVQTHTLISKTSLTPGAWTHVAVVADAMTQTKSIYINGLLDIQVTNYLYTNSTLADRELVAEFLNNRQRFLPGAIFSKIGNETALADRIKNNAQDAVTVKWFDIIRGFKTLTNEENADLLWQKKAWGASLPEAYRVYKQYRNAYNYYLHTDMALSWDILVGTDSTQKNGRRNFSGSLDELRIWNYARSAEQLLSDFRFIVRPESFLNPVQSLVAYYRFDEGFENGVVKDLMGGKLIKDVTKWCRIHEQTANDGRGEATTRERDYFLFETAFYDGADMSIPDSMTWVLSGADLIGYSDDRYSVPAPLMTVSVAPVLVPTTNKTDFAEQSAAATAPGFTTADTKLALTASGDGAAPVSNKQVVTLPKPVPNQFAAPDPVLDNTTPEPLPVLSRKAEASTSIVNSSAEVEQTGEELGTASQNLRAEVRISSQTGDNSARSNVFKRLLALITKKR